jgi:hypothetical protein
MLLTSTTTSLGKPVVQNHAWPLEVVAMPGDIVFTDCVLMLF